MVKKTTQKNTDVSKAASVFGRLGGRATVKKHGKSHMQEIGKKGGEARWKKDK